MTIAIGTHLLPFRTEKLNLLAPKILNLFGKIGRRRDFAYKIAVDCTFSRGLNFSFCTSPQV